MELGEKIRILRENKEWTQTELADRLNVSESTVQKWETEKNDPPLAELRRLAVIFDRKVGFMADGETSVEKIEEIEVLPERYFKYSSSPDCPDSEHRIFEVTLRKGARLHRFINAGGVPYSAIYIGHYERFSCVREHEQQMIDYWNGMEI